MREFAEEEIAPHAAEWDRKHHFPIDVVRSMGDLGLFGLTAPEEYGGADGDFTSLCVAIEELGRVDQSMGITLEAGVGLGIKPMQAYGTDEQKQRWLPDLVAGRTLAGFGLTEPGSGSDAGRAAYARGPARRRVGGQRGQAVHHQLRAATSRRWSRWPRVPVSDPTAGRRSPRSWCPPGRRGSSRSRPTTSSAGTPPTPTR